MRRLPLQRHAGDDGGRIEPTTQKRRDRHVAHQVRGDRLVEPLSDAFVRVPRVGDRLRGEVPVTASLGGSRAPPDHVMAGFEFAHVLERRGGSWDVAELQVGVERFPIEPARGESGGMQRLELGGEGDAPVAARDIQRLDPEAIPGQHERLGGGIPDGDREHATQAGHAVRSLLLIEVQHGFRVARRAECMTPREEPRPQIAIVVDLAVEDDDFGPVFVENRLVTAAQVDNAEASHSESDAPGHVQACIVGATMAQRVAHLPHLLLGYGPPALAVDNSCDAAHDAATAQD